MRPSRRFLWFPPTIPGQDGWGRRRTARRMGGAILALPLGIYLLEVRGGLWQNKTRRASSFDGGECLS